jgi:hypothetical protein
LGRFTRLTESSGLKPDTLDGSFFVCLLRREFEVQRLLPTAADTGRAKKGNQIASFDE